MNRIFPSERELPPPGPIRAGGFLIDPSRLEVLGPDGARIDLKPRSFRVLHHLAANAGHAVPKDEILTVCWPDVIVTDDSLTQAISEIRRALGEEGRDLIRTVPRVGYLLAADPAPAAAPEAPEAAPAPALARRVARRPLALAALGLVLLLAAVGWRFVAPNGQGLRRVESTVAVLPFRSIGQDDQLAYFSSGTTDFVVAQLARSPFLRVLAPGDAGVTPVEAGRSAGADYVLTGSAQRSAGTMRLTGQLIETATGDAVWTTSFDRQGADPFALQNELAEKVFASISGDLGVLSRRRYEESFGRDTSSFEEYDYFVRGHYWFFRYDREASTKAIAIFEEGLERYPGSTLLKVKLGWTHYQRFYMGWSADSEADLARAEALGEEIVTDPKAVPLARAYAHWLLAGVVIDRSRDYDRAEYERRIAIDLLGPDIYARNTLADVARAYGDPDEIIRSLRDIRPDDPGADWGYSALAWAHFVRRDIEQVRAVASLGVEMPPLYGPVFIAAAEVEAGNLDEARRLVATIRAAEPDVTLERLRRIHGTRATAALERELAALKAAGLP